MELVGNGAEWLWNFLESIPLGIKSIPSVSMYYDFYTTISYTNNKVFNEKNRHIGLRREFVKQLLKDGIIFIDYVKS